jgi:homoserine dehydrogenase
MLNLAIVGVGLVGSELIRQIAALPAKHASKFRIILISSSRHTLLNPPKDWKAALASAPAIDILSHLSNNKLDGQTVLVDNTSSDAVASTYPSYLKAGISIVTPNKKAFSGSLKLWGEILAEAEEGKARLLNESTVGAGLPIIAPLKEMIATGDQVRLSVAPGEYG